MAITRFRNSSILNRGPKYNDFLAGLPFRPIIGTATDGGTGTTVSVAFTGNNPAGAGITYTALSSPGNLTATGPASPITVSGLTAGTAYTFQVKAGNSLGDSAYSAASNSVTPVQPTAFDSIATITGNGSNAYYTFSNIPQTYQHLQIRGTIKLASSIAQDTYTFVMGLNGIGGSSHTSHRLIGNGTSASASASTGQSSIIFPDVIPSSHSSIADTVGTFIIDIHDYASTTKNKTVRYFGGVDGNVASGIFQVGLASGFMFANTNAITSLELGSTAGALSNKTTFALYGISG